MANTAAAKCDNNQQGMCAVSKSNFQVCESSVIQTMWSPPAIACRDGAACSGCAAAPTWGSSPASGPHRARRRRARWS